MPLLLLVLHLVARSENCLMSERVAVDNRLDLAPSILEKLRQRGFTKGVIEPQDDSPAIVELQTGGILFVNEHLPVESSSCHVVPSDLAKLRRDVDAANSHFWKPDTPQLSGPQNADFSFARSHIDESVG